MSELFEAQVQKFADMAEGLMSDLVKQSTQELFGIAQTTVHQGGKLPFDLGVLRASFTSELNDGQAKQAGPEAYTLTIANYESGDTISGYWTAEYAIHLEYGTAHIAPRAYMRSAAEQWQSIVEENVWRLAG